MKYFLILFFATVLLMHANVTDGQTFSLGQFNKPPIHYWPRPLWFWNNTTVIEEGIVRQMQAFRDQCGYGGFGVVPFGKNFRPEYLSDEYLRLYGLMLEKAKELGLTMSLYDEFGFPSGSVGAFNEGDGIPRFQLKFPHQTIERLDKEEEEISGPAFYEKKIPKGKLMGVVAMETNNKRRIDLSKRASDGTLKWKYRTDGRIKSSPAIGIDGTIYVGSYDKFIHAINPDGTLKWKYEADFWVESSPSIAGCFADLENP